MCGYIFSIHAMLAPLSSPNEKTSFYPIIRFLNLSSLEVWETVVAGTCCLMREGEGKNLDQTTMTKEIKKRRTSMGTSRFSSEKYKNQFWKCLENKKISSAHFRSSVFLPFSFLGVPLPPLSREHLRGKRLVFWATQVV